MNAVTEMPAPFVFTDSAAEKVKSLIEEEGNPDLKLRVFVSGGGCSGFQYGFTFDEAINDDDTTMQKNGVTLLIDAMSYQYLVGAEIDYKEDLEGAQFVIKNPNATTTRTYFKCPSFIASQLDPLDGERLEVRSAESHFFGVRDVLDIRGFDAKQLRCGDLGGKEVGTHDLRLHRDDILA